MVSGLNSYFTSINPHQEQDPRDGDDPEKKSARKITRKTILKVIKASMAAMIYQPPSFSHFQVRINPIKTIKKDAIIRVSPKVRLSIGTIPSITAFPANMNRINAAINEAQTRAIQRMILINFGL